MMIELITPQTLPRAITTTRVEIGRPRATPRAFALGSRCSGRSASTAKLRQGELGSLELGIAVGYPVDAVAVAAAVASEPAANRWPARRWLHDQLAVMPSELRSDRRKPLVACVRS
jgi:hypothetical protein